MISYKEALSELQNLPWPEGVRYYLTLDMMRLNIDRQSLNGLSNMQVISFEDCVTKAMVYLRAANPAITLGVVNA